MPSWPATRWAWRRSWRWSRTSGRKIFLLPFTAPWLQLSYGLFYTRKRPLSRVAQLFMTQLRQVEVVLQAREQRALARLDGKKRTRRSPRNAREAPRNRRPAPRSRPNYLRHAGPGPAHETHVAVPAISLALSAVSLAADAGLRRRLIASTSSTPAARAWSLRGRPLATGAPALARAPIARNDDGHSGVYRFEVRDADGQLLQARGYASIFGEWVTTDEAQTSTAPSTNRCAFRRPRSQARCS